MIQKIGRTLIILSASIPVAAHACIDAVYYDAEGNILYDERLFTANTDILIAVLALASGGAFIKLGVSSTNRFYKGFLIVFGVLFLTFFFSVLLHMLGVEF